MYAKVIHAKLINIAYAIFSSFCYTKDPDIQNLGNSIQK